MHELDTYLQTHFLDADAFAAHVGIAVRDVDALIERGLIPQPSYIVTPNATLISHVFGEMSAPQARVGRYFRPHNAAWVRRALDEHADDSAQRVKQRFQRGFALALAELNGATWRLDDSFDAAGAPIVAGLQARLDAAWTYFLNGTFSLCVASPDSERAIAEKEILQEKLGALTDNGAREHYSAAEREVLLPLIDRYARSAMPFSPVEYPRSSRKRLVDDLKIRLAAVAA